MKRKNEWKRIVLVIGFSVILLVLTFVVPVWAQEEGARKAPGFFDFWKRPRIWVSGVFSVIGLALLMKSWVTRSLRLLSLVVVFFTFAILSILPLGSFARGMSMHPSPMCVIEKPFLSLNAGRGIPLMFFSIFASIGVLTIIGNKLFCGWACPLGAIQEILHRIPISRKLKIKLPFKITNLVRILVFILFVILTFGVGHSIYAYLNPFEFFHWGFGVIASIAIALTLIAALFIFRPFCYVLCPLGLFTWFLEHISLFRVKLNKELCTDCNVCIDKSPCPTVPFILKGKRIRPDCHPCGRCIEVCPEQALKFKK